MWCGEKYFALTHGIMSGMYHQNNVRSILMCWICDDDGNIRQNFLLWNNFCVRSFWPTFHFTLRDSLWCVATHIHTRNFWNIIVSSDAYEKLWKSIEKKFAKCEMCANTFFASFSFLSRSSIHPSLNTHYTPNKSRPRRYTEAMNIVIELKFKPRFVQEEKRRRKFFSLSLVFLLVGSFISLTESCA